jgi:hypothetical protein
MHAFVFAVAPSVDERHPQQAHAIACGCQQVENPVDHVLLDKVFLGTF